jgi:hypothetical protein
MDMTVAGTRSDAVSDPLIDPASDPLSVRDGPLLDQQLVARAFALARPSIEALLVEPGASGERLLHMVVAEAAERSSFDAAIIAEESFGARPPWGADYRAFARAKARLCWRTGHDTREVQHRLPQLLQPGDTLLWGSAVGDGLIVAASGAHPWFDEACCGIVMSVLRGLAQARRRDMEPGV